MSGYEFNKIAASFLFATLILLLTGFFVDMLYKPKLSPKERGYKIAVQETDTSSENASVVKEEFKIDIKELMKTASSEAGKGAISKCIACHSVDRDGPNKVGPHLWDIVGKKKATSEGYKYSSALKAMGDAGEVWDYDKLAKFIHKPKDYAPGTKMSFAGISKPEDIANIIAYLRELSDNPQPLPE